MILSVLKRSAPFAVAAAVLFAGSSVRAASFDGPWTVVIITQSGNCDAAYSFVIRPSPCVLDMRPSHNRGKCNLARQCITWLGDDPELLSANSRLIDAFASYNLHSVLTVVSGKERRDKNRLSPCKGDIGDAPGVGFKDFDVIPHD